MIEEVKMAGKERNVNDDCEFLKGGVYDCCDDCWRREECEECADTVLEASK